MRRLGLVTDSALAPMVQLIGGPEKYAEQLVQGVCQASAAFCTGNITQYANQTDCETFLRSLPVSNFDNADEDNLSCRVLHAMLVPLRPAVHCSHIGKTGGSKCVPHPPNLLFTDDFSVCST